nr:hypothetical protein HK105_002523 [Polyrhizophydium stewartii]
MASGLSSNWKSLAKTLGKKPAKSSSSRQRPSAPAPGEAPADDGSAAQAKRHRTEDTQDSSTAAPAGSGQPSAASPAHDSLASDTPAAIVSTVKRDLGILESLLTAKSSFLSPPSDDEDTDNVASSGAGVANPARKRKRATESAAAIPPLQSETKYAKAAKPLRVL